MAIDNKAIVAIPSHRRAETLESCALAFLDRVGFPRSRVFVFVSDGTDRAAYQHITGINLVYDRDIGSLREKFNFIRRYFEIDQRIFLMEDDVVSIVEKTGENKSVEVTRFQAFLDEGFSLMESARARIWGVSPHSNAFYMTNDNSLNLKFIVAHAFGMLADREERRDITLDGKSDYERTILYYLADGKTPRLNRFGVKAIDSYKGKGGLQAEFGSAERREREEKSVRYLITRYSLLCYENKTKKSIMPEIKLRQVKSPHSHVVQQQQKLERSLGY